MLCMKSTIHLEDNDIPGIIDFLASKLDDESGINFKSSFYKTEDPKENLNRNKYLG